MSIGQSQAGRKRGRRAVGQICGREGEISSATGGAVRRRASRPPGTASVFRFPGALAVWRSAPARPRRTDAEQARGCWTGATRPPTSHSGLRQPRHAQEGDSLEGVRVPSSAAVGPALRLPFDAEAREVAELREEEVARDGARRLRRPPRRRVGDGAGENPSRLAEANGRQGGTGLADDGRRRSLPAQVGLPHNHLATRRWADPAQSTHQRTGLPIRALRGPNHRQVVPGPLVRSRESGHRSVARTHLAWLQWRRLKTCYYREEGRVAGWPPLKAAALPFDWGHSGNSRRRSFRLVRCREWRCQAKVGAGTRDRRGSTHGIELPPGKLSASRGSGGGLKPLTGQEEVAPNGACHAVRRATRERTRFGARS